MNAKKTLLWAVALALPPAAGAGSAVDQLKLAAGARDMPAVAAPAAAAAGAGSFAESEAAEAGAGLLLRLYHGYVALEGRSIVEPGDPFYEDAVLLRRMNGQTLRIEGVLEAAVGRPNILGKRTAVLHVREPAGESRAPLLFRSSYRLEELERWLAGYPTGQAVAVTLRVRYNYRSVDNWPFVVERVETLDAGAAPPRSAGGWIALLGAVTETAVLARAVEASAGRELARKPDSAMAREWSLTAGKLAQDLETERTKLMEAVRSSDAAMERELEIARSLLGPARDYLARAKRYLDILEEGRSRALPGDIRQGIERDLEDMRGHIRRIMRY